MRKIYILIFVVFIISLFVGYAAGRGYKTYEINSQKKTGQSSNTPLSTNTSLSNPDTQNLDKELVDPETYAPKITGIATDKDLQNGYNLNISAQHFDFSSKSFGKPVEQNSGYAYVFVNDQPVGRAYSSLYHVPENFFKSGTNTVTVVLHANNYKTWWSKKGTLEASYSTEVVR